MKKYLILALTILSLSTLAQQKDTVTIYLKGTKNVKNIKGATTIAKVFKDSNNTWIKITSDKNWIPLKKERFSDSLLTTLNGDYTEYGPGKAYLEGVYTNNKRNGIWVAYRENGKRVLSKNYINGKISGAYSTYNEEGSLEEEGNFSEGMKIGEWKIWHPNGKLAANEFYNNKFKLVDSAYFNTQGVPIVRDSLIKAPSFPGGIKVFYQYVAKSLRYPSESLMNKTQGKVYLSFEINKEGKIENAIIVSAPAKDIGEEALRVLTESPNWIAGTLFNKPRVSAYNINISFYLNL